MPRKNIKTLCGKPLIAYTIETALASSRIDRVIVSTEDKEIAKIAEHYGAEVPFLRPIDLAKDESITGDAVNYTLQKLLHQGDSFQSILIMYPSHPFRTMAMIDAAIDSLKEDFVRFQTVRPIHVGYGSHVMLKDDCTVIPLMPRLNGLKFGMHYCPYGLIIGYRFEGFSGPCQNYIIHDPVYLIDIDTLEDFALAESVVRHGMYH